MIEWLIKHNIVHNHNLSPIFLTKSLIIWLVNQRKKPRVDEIIRMNGHIHLRSPPHLYVRAQSY